jgi:PAS domain S-box-containing protein
MNMANLKVLILEDSQTDAELIRRLLKKAKPECEFHLAMSQNEFLHALEHFSPDVILSDNSLPQFSALEAMKVARRKMMQVPFILITGTVSDEFAAEIIKHGADDYILKDRMVRLPAAIDAALKQKKLEKEKLEATDKLIKSEEKYRTIFSKSPLPTWIYDPETLRFLEVNEAAIRHYGYSHDQFLNMTLKDIRPPEDIEAVLKEVKIMDLRSDAQQGVWRHIKKNGQLIIVETMAHAIDYGNRKVRMVIANDITENIAAKEELSRNELRFRTLTSNAPVGIFQTDANGKTIYVNETWMKFTGLSFDEAMGEGWIRCLHPDDKEKQIKQWGERLQSGLESTSDFRLVDKKGNTRWVTGKATPLFDKTREVTGYIGTLSDITENKKAEELIQKSEEQYRDLVEHITDLICTHDLNGRVLSVNRAAEELMGHKFNSNEYINIKDILAPDKKDEFDLYIDTIKKQGRARGLMKVKTFKGTIHIWEYNNSLKTEGVDEPVVRGYARDITESRIAEENLRKSEARLKEAQSIAHISNWEFDLVEKTLSWSEETYRIYGITKGEVELSIDTFLSFVHPEDSEFAKQKVQEAFHSLIGSSFNFRFVRRDGAIRHGYSEWKFEFDKKGSPLRLYGILQDVTERVEAEQEKKRLELILLEQQKREQVMITAITLEAQEKERNAIGVELHDNVNQILVGTKLLLSTVKEVSNKNVDVMAACMKNLQDAIDENRKIAHSLVTPDLDSDTLAEQIKRLITSMLKPAGVRANIDIANYKEELLNKEQKIAIYRIAQEQCTNIVKYAQATEVNVSISNNDKQFKMIIADNGIGMEPGKKTFGIGLRNINSRLSIFNGKANVITSPGQGFTLEIEILL